MSLRDKLFSKNIEWILLIILVNANLVRVQPTSCTEDSQCPSEFYCESGAHLCRECVRCEALRRAPAQPPRACVRSVVECGACLHGLVPYQDESGGGACVPAGAGAGAAPLPPYAWGAIALTLLLFVLILCIFANLNSIKIFYSSHASVQSQAHGDACAAPPPYNLGVLAPPSSPTDDYLEKSRLIGLSHPCSPSPEWTPSPRSRENSGVQAARVYTNPSYIRLPQDVGHTTTELPALEIPENPSRDMNIMPLNEQVGGTTAVNYSTNDFNGHACKREDTTAQSLAKKKNADPEVESNNNSSEESSGTSSQRAGAQYCGNVLTGPSFVINVVEHINNVQQNNKNSVSDFQYAVAGMNIS